MEQYVIKDGKSLRLGYTTGSCATAAAKAAARMLLTGEAVDTVSIVPPKGIPLKLEVLETAMNPEKVRCAIRKDGGDDPDITSGTLIFAEVSKRSDGEIFIDGGFGVGRVTKRGLDQPPGNAAINSTPRRMIRENLQEVSTKYGYTGGFSVIISVPEGEKLAKKTFLMKIEPIDRCISALKAEREYDEVIFTTPDGEQFNQPMANTLSMSRNLIILCGHFKGIDYRIREHFITKEISIGDYVLTGGELAAAVIADSIVRIIPGVISDEQSALSDSFQDNLLAPPVYTRPSEYKGWKVPDVLLSGHEARIREWEFQQSMERTQRLRPDLLEDK